MTKIGKTRKITSLLKDVLIPALFFAGLILLFVFGVSGASSRTEEEKIASTQRALRKAAVTCYASEGAYPANADYLEEHYGVVVDHDRYLVYYDCIGANIMPSIQVVEKGAQ